MRKYFSFLPAAFLFLFAAQLQAQMPGKDWLKLREGIVTARYPANWELNQSGVSGTKFIVLSPIEGPGDDFRENVNLVVQNIKGRNMTLQAFVELSNNQVMGYFENCKMLVSQHTKKAGRPAHKMAYTATEAEMDLHFVQYFWIIDEMAYVLTFTTKIDAYDRFKTTGTAIMDSLRFGK